MALIYYSNRIQSKICRFCTPQVNEAKSSRNRHKLLKVLSQLSHRTLLFLPARSCDNTSEMLSTREGHHKRLSARVLLGLVTEAPCV